MKNKAIYLIIIITLIFVSCSSTIGNQKSDIIEKNQTPKKYFSQDGKFKILFEEEPTSYSQFIPYEEGKVLMNYFIYEKGINLIYCLSYADYPASFIQGKVKEDILILLLNNYINYQRAGLEVQRQVQVNSYPGIYFKASNGDTFVFGEYILRDNRLYQITVTKEGGYANDADANSFIQSLELL